LFRAVDTARTRRARKFNVVHESGNPGATAELTVFDVRKEGVPAVNSISVQVGRTEISVCVAVGHVALLALNFLRNGAVAEVGAIRAAETQRTKNLVLHKVVGSFV